MSNLISRADLEAALLAGTVTLVDALPAAYHRKRHLPGALNLVQEDVAAHASDLLPDKDALVVTYCSDLSCGNSDAVAAELTKLGYARVLRYAEGINDWVAAGGEVVSCTRV